MLVWVHGLLRLHWESAGTETQGGNLKNTPVWLRLQSGAGLGGHVVDDRFQVALGFFENFELAVGARAGLHNFADAVDGFPAAELVHLPDR